MSKTDKTTPTWVVTMRHGVVTHDHRTGNCVIEDRHAPQPKRWKHTSVCAKRVVVTDYCTKREPNVDTLGNFRWQNCWTMGWDDEQDRAVWRSCSGHKRTEWNDAIPCGCDRWPAKPTCWIDPPDTHRWARRPDPKRRKGATRSGGPGRKTDQRQAIADFDEVERDVDTAGLKRLARVAPGYYVTRCPHGLAEWEVFLEWNLGGCRCMPWQFTTERHYPEPPVVEDEEDPAEWFTSECEWWGVLLGADDQTKVAWSTAAVEEVDDCHRAAYTPFDRSERTDAWVDPDCDDYRDEPEDVLDDEHEGDWLAATPEEFFDAVGDAWVIEGPSGPSEPTRPEPHYARVYDLAWSVGIEARHMVRHLRLTDEYVRGHMSFVARPVIDRVVAQAPELVEQYGQRRDKPSPARVFAALLSEERAKVTRPRPIRPGAPRPGINPFLEGSIR